MLGPILYATQLKYDVLFELRHVATEFTNIRRKLLPDSLGVSYLSQNLFQRAAITKCDMLASVYKNSIGHYLIIFTQTQLYVEDDNKVVEWTSMTHNNV